MRSQSLNPRAVGLMMDNPLGTRGLILELQQTRLEFDLRHYNQIVSHVASLHTDIKPIIIRVRR